MKTEDRYLGCMLGLALGDALGAPVEFLSLKALKLVHGPEGVTSLPLYPLYTDDTQMSLATAYGLLDYLNSGQNPVDAVYERYLEWLQSQNNPSERRSPGRTCLTALARGKKGSVTNWLNDSKGCGGVMRVAPVGLVAKSAKETFELGRDCAALTHTHPTGYLAAGFLAQLVYHVVNDMNLMDALKECRKTLKEYSNYEETLKAVDHACYLAASSMDVEIAVEKLGEGWVAEEALAVTVYCSLKYQNDWKAGVCAAVNHSGDSDSTGSMVGAVLGTLLGVGALPKDWVVRVENKKLLEGLSHTLYEFSKNKL